MKLKASHVVLVVTAFVATLAVVWFATSGLPIAALTNTSADRDYLAPSGTTYPYPNTPETFRSRAPDWEMEGEKWEDLSPERQRKETLDTVWEARAFFLSLDADPAELVERWLPSVHDPHGVIDSAELRRVLTMIAEHARARSADTPGAFRSLVEADPSLEWRDAITGSYRFQFQIFYDFFLEKPLDLTRHPRVLLDEVWDGLAQHDHLFSEAGHGPHGAIFLVDRLRSSRLLGAMFHGAGAPEDVSNWLPSGSRAPMTFTEPAATIDETIARHGSVLVVRARIVTRLRDGRLGLWDPTWFLDPDSGRWIIESMGSCSSNTFMTIM